MSWFNTTVPSRRSPVSLAMEAQVRQSRASSTGVRSRLKGGFIRIAWLLLGLIILGIANLYFGNDFLFGGFIGGDDGLALFNIDYLYHYWPGKVLWQPSHGAGFSMLGINLGAFWLVAMTARLLSWTAVQAMHFWQWLSMYLASLGVFGLGWVLFSPLVGLAAGFFFLLSQISWFWGRRIGLLAFQMSFVFVPLFFVFLYKLFQAEKEGMLKRRLFLFFASSTLALSIWFHLVTGVLIAGAGFFYTFLISPSKTSSWWWRFKGYLLVMLVGIGLTFPYLIPYIYHNQRAFMGEITYLALKDIPAPPLGMFLGLGGPPFYIKLNPKLDLWYGFFALPVLILGLLGVSLALVKKKRNILALFFISLIFFLFASAAYHFPSLVSLFTSFFSLTNIRSILIPMIFVPLMAGYGVIALSGIFASKVKNPFFNLALVFLLSLGIVVSLVWQFDRAPSGFLGRCGSSYGLDKLPGEECPPNLSEVFSQRLSYLISPSSISLPSEEPLTELASAIPRSDNLRADLTAKRGESIQLWGKVSDVPILQSGSQATVIPIHFLTYQLDNFYNKETDAEAVSQIAAWFGIDYVLLEGERGDPLDNFTGWPIFTEIREIQIRKSPHPVGLATHSSRPAILFFGDPKQEAYFKWWQLLVHGGLDHSRAFIVDGEAKIESFKPEEIRQFDVLVFWGESYKKMKKADKIIKEFLENGGKILIDTGWQYTSPFWGKETLPEWLPVTATRWQSFESWNLESQDPLLERLVSSWQAPKWEGKPWGASAADPNLLRSSASALITDTQSGSILVARMPYGKGEVIWTGLNLVGIYHVNDNLVDDVHWLLLTNLLPAKIQDYPVEVRRLDPEVVEINLQAQSEPTWLYFRESFYPSWAAKLDEEESEGLFKSGPGLLLLKVPAGVSQILLYHKRHWPIIVGWLFFGLIVIGLLAELFYSVWLKKKKD